MEQIKLVVFKDNIPYELDVDNNESIEIQYEVKGLDIENRKTFFTKTFTLIGTKINNQFFQHNFTGSNGFINQNYDCKLYVNGGLVINGVLILKEINVDKYNNNILYSVEIVNKFYDFIERFGDDLIVGNEDETKDLDFSYIEQFATYQPSQMVQSWTGTSKTFPFVYTIKNLGYDWDPSMLDGTSTASYAYLNKLRQDSVGVFPDLYAKTLLDLIFKKGDINVKSNFFNSEVFEKLVILNGRDELDFSNQFIYTEGPSTGQTVSANTISTIQIGYNTVPSTSLFIINNEFIPTGLTIDRYNFTIEGDINRVNGAGTVWLQSEVLNPITNTWFIAQTKDITPVFTARYGNSRHFDFSVSYDLTANKTLGASTATGNGVRFSIWFIGANIPATDITQVSNIKLNVTSDKKSVSGKNLIPKGLKIRDFLVALFRTYNLVIWDESGDIRIEPYKDFYNNQTILNLTNNNIVDKSSYNLLPMSDEIPNSIIGNYEVGDDYKSVYFENKYGSVYGNANVSIGGNNNNRTIEMNQVLTQFEDMRGPKFPLLYDIENDNKKKTIDVGLRFAYYNGLQTFYKIKIDDIEYTKIPITSLFLNLDEDEETLKLGPITSDLIDSQSSIGGLTSTNGLLTTYYGDELALYDINEYKLTIRLNTKFDLNFSLSTLVYLEINGIPKYYRIESITFSSDNSVLTEMVLIPISYNNIKINITNSEGTSGTSIPEDLTGDNDSNGVSNTNGGYFNRTNGNSNYIGYSDFIETVGNGNFINNGVKNVFINGDNNLINSGVTNSILLGSNNILPENESNGIWVDGERINPYKTIKILTSGETLNLHSTAVEVLPNFDGYITDITDAYLSIEYPTGITPTAYGNIKINLYYSGNTESDNLVYFDNKLLDSTTYNIHKGVPSYDKSLKSKNILAKAENVMGSGNGILKFQIYYRKLKI